MRAHEDHQVKPMVFQRISVFTLCSWSTALGCGAKGLVVRVRVLLESLSAFYKIEKFHRQPPFRGTKYKEKLKVFIEKILRGPYFSSRTPNRKALIFPSLSIKTSN